MALADCWDGPAAQAPRRRRLMGRWQRCLSRFAAGPRRALTTVRSRGPFQPMRAATSQRASKPASKPASASHPYKRERASMPLLFHLCLPTPQSPRLPNLPLMHPIQCPVPSAHSPYQARRARCESCTTATRALLGTVLSCTCPYTMICSSTVWTNSSARYPICPSRLVYHQH